MFVRTHPHTRPPGPCTRTWVQYIHTHMHHRMCDMTHSYVTCLIHIWDMTHQSVGHDTFMRVTWLMHTPLHASSQYGAVYGVALVSRLLKITGLFCKRALWKRRYSAKETYNCREPTNRSHPIFLYIWLNTRLYATRNLKSYSQTRSGDFSMLLVHYNR